MTKVILCTARTLEATRNTCDDGDDDVFYNKPFSRLEFTTGQRGEKESAKRNATENKEERSSACERSILSEREVGKRMQL